MATGKFENELLLGDTVRMRNAGLWDGARDEEPTALCPRPVSDNAEQQAGEDAAESPYRGEAANEGGPGDERAEHTNR